MGWLEVYESEMSKFNSVNDYINAKVGYKKTFIELIEKYNTTGKLIEAGTGTGTFSTYLASIGYDVLGIDIDDNMLKLANKLGEEYGKEKKAKFIKKSIFELDYDSREFSICFSNGVLEHFEDDKIIETLSKQMDIAETVIFGIPTKYFTKKEAMYGDERYLNFSYWRKLIKKAGGGIVEERSMDYLGVKSRLFSIKKWFKPRPFRIFVIRKEK